jgi:CubicO group peptidase (beta-lactamase class C family)
LVRCNAAIFPALEVERSPLAETQLKRAPGSQCEYSNFALMVLSYAPAKHSGKDFETLLRERLLSPLGMDDTFIVTSTGETEVI